MESHDSPQREDTKRVDLSRPLESFYYQVIRKCIVATHRLCVFRVFYIDRCMHYSVVTN